MTQHFLISAKSPDAIGQGSALYGRGGGGYETFCKVRWADTHGSPVYPRCGSVEFYNVTRGRCFKCKGCRHQFSATSGTIFRRAR